MAENKAKEKEETKEIKAEGRNLRISHKLSMEIGKWIKNDSVAKAKNKLERVIEKDLAVPYTRTKGGSHRKGNKGSGGYPVKASKEILKVLRSAEENAKYEGLSSENLKVSNVITNQGTRFLTPKRFRGRRVKSTHIKVMLKER